MGEKAKKALSAGTSTTISLPFIAQVDGAPVNFEIDLSRAEQAKERAENRLKMADQESILVTQSRIALSRAINRIRIKKGRN